MVFIVGAKVEVVGKGILRYSYYEATIEKIEGRNATIRYDSLKDSTGDCLTEQVNLRSIRPDPGVVVTNLKAGDLVDVYRAGGWWVGFIVDESKHEFHVHFDHVLGQSQCCKVHKSNVRIHSTWKIADPRNYWVVDKEY